MTDRTCIINDCDRDASGKRGGGRGWCSTHYQRWRRHGDPEHGGQVIRQTGTGQPCTIDGCAEPVIAREMCSEHYRRQKRNGDPLAGRVTPGRLTSAERFWANVDKTETCWMWTGAVNSSGYGTITADDQRYLVHRYSLVLAGHALTPGLTIDHLCRVRLCVNPAHLEEVTYGVNLERARDFAVGARSADL